MAAMASTAAFAARPTRRTTTKYRIPSTTKGVDSIVEHILVESTGFRDLDALTKQIEGGTLKFIEDVEGFLSKHENRR
jgi:hypothetical protein